MADISEENLRAQALKAKQRMLDDLERSVKSGSIGAAKSMLNKPLTFEAIRGRTTPKDGDIKDAIYAAGGGYAIPYFDINGKPVSFTRFRLFESKLKYWQASGTTPRVYYSPNRKWAAITRNAKLPIIAVEGEKKAYRGNLENDLNVLSIGGVWSFQSKKLGRTLLRDLEAIDWMGRDAYIAYDSDLADNEQVANAEEHFAEELALKGAKVKLIRLTAATDGSKRGLDDFLEQEGGAAFKKLMDSAEPYVEKFAELNRDCAVIVESGDILTLTNGNVYTYNRFKNVIGATYSQRVLTQKGKRTDVSLIPGWLASKTRNEIEAMVFEPAQYDPKSRYYITSDGKRYYNRYNGRDIQPEAGDVTPWLDVFQHVFGNASEKHRNYVLDMLAFKAKYPGDRLNLALLIIGGQGIGKSLLLETYGMAFGRFYHEITNDDLHSQYTGDWLLDALVILGNELTRRGHNDTADAGRVKNLITNATHKINNKFGARFSQTNHTFFMLTSENPNPLKIVANERRYYIHNALSVKSLPTPLVKRLKIWRDKENGLAHLLDWLLKRKISASFNPTADAWESEGKRMVATTSEDPFERIANELIDHPRKLWDMKSLLDQFDPIKEYRREIAEKRIMEALYRVDSWLSKKTRISATENKRVWVIGRTNVETWSKPNADLRTEWERFAALPMIVERTEEELARKAGIEAGKVTPITGAKRKAGFKR